MMHITPKLVLSFNQTFDEDIQTDNHPKCKEELPKEGSHDWYPLVIALKT
jgi:hypothetical protein